MTLPDLTAKATLDTRDFLAGVERMEDAMQRLQKQGKALTITAKLATASAAAKATPKQHEGLTDAAIKAEQAKRKLSELFGEYEQGGRAAKQLTNEQRALIAEIQKLDRAIRITRADFQAVSGAASEMEIDQLSRQMRGFQEQLEKLGPAARREFGEYSAQVQKLANANRLAGVTAQAASGQITRLGIASQMSLGVRDALSAHSATAQNMGLGFIQLANNAQKAQTAANLFNKTLEKTNTSSSEAKKAVAELANELQTSEQAAADSVRLLLNRGYTLEQATGALRGAGASAIAAGRDAEAGFGAFTDAIMSGSSAALNGIGISENLSTMWQAQAKALGKNVDQLTDYERAMAEAKGIIAATAGEVEELPDLLSGTGAAASKAQREFTAAMTTMSTVIVEPLSNVLSATSRFVEAFNALPKPVKAFIGTAAALGVTIVALSGPLLNVYNGFEILKGKLVQSTAATVAQTGASAGLTATLKAQSAALATATAGWGALAAAATAAGVGIVAAGKSYSVAMKNIEENEAALNNQAKAHELMTKAIRGHLNGQTALGNAQARAAATKQRVNDFKEQGIVTGVSHWGKIKRDTSSEKYKEQLKAYEQAADDAAKAVQRLQAAEDKRRVSLGLEIKLTDGVKAARKDAAAALEKGLSDRAVKLRLEGKTQFQKDIQALSDELNTMREAAKKPFYVNGQLHMTPELKSMLNQLDKQGAAEKAALKARAAKEAAGVAVEAHREAARATVEAWADSNKRRDELRRLDVEDAARAAKEQAAAYRDFPEEQARILQAGRVKIAAMRARWAKEDLAAAKEQAAALARLYTEAQQQQATARISALQASRARLDLQHSRQNGALQGDEGALAQAALQQARAVAKIEDRIAKERREAELNALAARHRDELKAEGVTNEQRRLIVAKYHAERQKLEQDSTAAALQRVKTVEEAERAALERIRQARMQDLQRQLSRAEQRAETEQYRAQFATSESERIRGENRVAAAIAGQVAAAQQLLSNAGRLKMAADERERAEGAVTAALRRQQEHARAVADAQKESLKAAKEQAVTLLEMREQAAKTDTERLAAQNAQLARARQDVIDGRRQMGKGTNVQQLEATRQVQASEQRVLDLEQRVSETRAAGLERANQLLRQQSELTFAQDGDAVANARRGFDLAAQQVNQAKQALSVADTQAQKEQARLTLMERQKDLLTAGKALDDARNDAQQRRLSLMQKEVDAAQSAAAAFERQLQALQQAAEQLRGVLAATDGLSTANDRLQQQAGGGDSRRATERLYATAERRDAAGQGLIEAIKSGNAELVKVAAERFSALQDRVLKQLESGVSVWAGDEGRLVNQDLVKTVADLADKFTLQTEKQAPVIERQLSAAERQVVAAERFAKRSDSLNAAVERLETNLKDFAAKLQENTSGFKAALGIVQQASNRGRAAAPVYNDNSAVYVSVSGAVSPDDVARAIERRINEIKSGAQRDKMFNGGC